MTKMLFTALLVATALTGCAKHPLAVASAEEPERVVHIAPKPSGQKPVVAEVGAVSPTYVSHEAPAASLQVSHTASSFVGSTPLLPGENPTLAVVKGPTRSFRAFPGFVTDTDVDSVEFSPSKTKAEWTLEAKGSLIVGKVKVAVLGADGKEAATNELTAAEVGLASRAGAEQILALDPVSVPAILDYLKQNPTAKGLTLKLTLEDATGQPVLQDKTKPLELSLPMQVL